MRLNLSNEPDAQDFTPLPAGNYYFKIDSIDDSKSHKDGWQKWSMRLKAVEPPYKNRMVFDNFIFSPSKVDPVTKKTKVGGLSRIKLMRKNMGLACEGDIDIEKEEYIGRVVYVKLEVEPDYKDPNKLRNKIPFNGYLELKDEIYKKAKDLELAIANNSVPDNENSEGSVMDDNPDIGIEDVPF